MKKTLSVNLGGIAFQIDEDAYMLLERYLNDLQEHFRNTEDAAEIVRDIEARIAELLSERMNGNHLIVAQEDVECIIARIGKPEELTEEEAEVEASTEKRVTGKRVYRNPDDKLVGGVCGGLALYLDCNPTWLRLLAILLFIPFSGFMFPAYLVCWIIIPEARTTAEKLNMRGESVTVENIGKTVIAGFDQEGHVQDGGQSGSRQTLLQRILEIVVTVAAFFFKFCLVLLVLAFIPALFVMTIVAVALLVMAVVYLAGGSALLYSLPFGVPASLETLLASLGGLLTVGIPVGLLVYLMLQTLFHWKPMPVYVKWILVVLWIAGIAIGTFGLMHHTYDFWELTNIA